MEMEKENYTYNYSVSSKYQDPVETTSSFRLFFIGLGEMMTTSTFVVGHFVGVVLGCDIAKG